jgi:hypothetical protein
VRVSIGIPISFATRAELGSRLDDAADSAFLVCLVPEVAKVMDQVMIAGAHQLKVPDSIVGRIAIAMVNVFISEKPPAKMLLHNHPMLKRAAIAHAMLAVSVGTYTPGTIWRLKDSIDAAIPSPSAIVLRAPSASKILLVTSIN